MIFHMEMRLKTQSTSNPLRARERNTGRAGAGPGEDGEIDCFIHVDGEERVKARKNCI